MFYKLYNVLKKENLLEQSFSKTSESVKILHQMFIYSKDELRNNASNNDFDIYLKDKEINAIERNIRRNSLTHLAVNDQEDLNAVLILLTIIHDFERIGDYLKNIYELSLKIDHHLDFNEHEAIVKSTEENIISMFIKLSDDFKDIEKEEARKHVDKLNNDKKKIEDAIDKIIDTAETSKINPKELIISVMYLRYIKRVLSHLTNILSSFVNPFDRIGFEE